MEKESANDPESQPLTPISDEPDHFQFVYCVNPGYLPSHIRTVELATEKLYQQKDNIEVIKQKPERSTRCKCVVVIVTVVLLFLVSSVIALSVWKILNSTMDKDHLSKVLGIQISKNTSESAKNNTPKSKSTDLDTDLESRSRCSKVCFSYSAFKFISKCVDGYCVCRGEGYHHLTCLPKVNGCSINKRNNKFALSKYKGIKQRTFSCVTDKQSSEEIHVISNFGNQYADTTVINIMDSRINFNRPVVLVLTNYQRVRWTINVTDKINLKTVYLISNKNLKYSEVILNNKKSDLDTDIVKMYSQIGYGDDRNGGHTVDLLQKIANEIGDITTFAGTSRADEWTLDLKDSYSLVT